MKDVITEPPDHQRSTRARLALLMGIACVDISQSRREVIILGAEHGQLAAIQAPHKECSEFHRAAHQRQTLVFARSTTSSARPLDHGLHHVEGEALRHLERDGRRHRELRPVHDRIDQNGAVMRQSAAAIPSSTSARVFEPDAADADRFGHRREVRVLEVRCRNRGSRWTSAPARRSRACRC